MKPVVADSSQIEARVLPWVAGQQDLLDVFRRNDVTKGDFYSDAGSAFFGKKLSKKETPTERQASKSMLLGLGYAMGWAKFAFVLLGQGVQFTEKDAEAFGVHTAKFLNDAKKMKRVQEIPSRLSAEALAVHCAVVEFLVQRYRKTYAKIPEFWNECEDVLEVMAPDEPHDGEERATFGPGGCLKVLRHAIKLPNGMLLRYPGLRKSEDGDGFSYIGEGSGKSRKNASGGSITENIVQALARIIVAEQMLLIRAKFEKDFGCVVSLLPSGIYVATGISKPKHPLVTMTHDEVVAAVKDDHAEAALAFALETMKRPPVWAPDLPLNAAGDIGDSYGEAK